MRKLLVLIAGVLFSGIVAGQSLQKLEDVDGFHRRLREAAVGILSIECDFVQEKYLDVFAEKVLSEGKFCFRKENKILLSYSRPLNYLIVINGRKLKIVSDGKTNVVDLGSNKMMNGMNSLLSGCMTGDLEGLKEECRMEYSEDERHYVVHITPREEGVKAYLAGMDIWFDKKDMAVVKLRLSENASDYTEYRFSDRRFNTLNSDEKFIIP